MMDAWITLLLWLHLAALAVGGASAFGMPLIGMTMAKAPPEARPVLGGIARRLTMLGRGAVTVLIVTGILMIWSAFGLSGLSPWFWVKMLLVLVTLGLMVYGPMMARRAMSGDTAAAAMLPRLGAIGMANFLLIVLAAVLAFG